MTKKNGVKKQCWMCRGWQDTAYMVNVNFDGLDEPICLSCKSMLDAREDNLEQRIIEDDIDQEEIEKRVQEAKAFKIKREQGDSDEAPAKEDYLP